MADFDTLLSEVLPDTPQCPDPLAVREIRNATIELCIKALLFKQRRTGQSVAADNPYVAMPLPAGTELIHLRDVTLDGRDVHHRSADFLDLAWSDQRLGELTFQNCHGHTHSSMAEGWRTLVSDRPDTYHIEIDDAGVHQIRLVGIPRQAYTTLSYRMVLKPSRTSTGFATWVLDKYFQTIAAGAIANLLALPKKPWSDMAAAAVYRSKFAEGVAVAIGEGARDFTRDDESQGRVTPYV